MQQIKITYPLEGELVIGTVKKVFQSGAFVKLDEYNNIEGMIHISEISAKWIKNIRDYVREGDRVVVKVLRIDKARNHIDLSLKSVKAQQKKERLDEHKKEQRGKKLLEFVGQQIKDKDHVKDVGDKILEKFDNTYTAFEMVKRDGISAFEKVDIPKNWIDGIAKTAESKIEIQKKTIDTVVEMTSNAPNGIEVIKDSLSKAIEESKAEGVDIAASYLGAPRYQVIFEGEDYKELENSLERFSKSLTKSASFDATECKIIRENQ